MSKIHNKPIPEQPRWEPSVHMLGQLYDHPCLVEAPLSGRVPGLPATIEDIASFDVCQLPAAMFRAPRHAVAPPITEEDRSILGRMAARETVTGSNYNRLITVRRAFNTNLSRVAICKARILGMELPGYVPTTNVELAEPLTYNEVGALAYTAIGRTPAAIAPFLRLMPSTVKWTLHVAYAKLGVHRDTAAILRAFDLGLFVVGPRR
jgi:DNA-binding CsgD family transcriptional regulator